MFMMFLLLAYLNLEGFRGYKQFPKKLSFFTKCFKIFKVNHFHLFVLISKAFLQLAYAKESMLTFHNDLLHYSYKNLAGQNDQLVFLSENSNILREINHNYLSYPLQNQNHSSCCPFSKIPNSNFPKTFSPENNQVESYNENQQLFSHQNNLNQINQNNYTNSSNPVSDVFDESDLKVEEPVQEKQEPVIEDGKEMIGETKLENDIKEEIESSPPSFSNEESVKEMSSEIKEEQLFSPKQEGNKFAF